MKATGIVRRIDDLGRVVIPKEIRKNLHIREWDPVEFFTENDGVVIKKYVPEEGLLGKLRHLSADINDDTDVIGCDKEKQIQELLKQVADLLVTENDS